MIVLAEDFSGDAAMNAIAAPKSSAQNRLEGFVLTALFQGFPTFAAAALLLKLARHEIAGGAGAVRRDGLDLPRPVHALARTEISKVLQAQLRAAVLQREPVVRRKAREMAHAAHGIAATGDDVMMLSLLAGRAWCDLSTSFRGVAKAANPESIGARRLQLAKPTAGTSRLPLERT